MSFRLVAVAREHALQKRRVYVIDPRFFAKSRPERGEDRVDDWNRLGLDGWRLPQTITERSNDLRGDAVLQAFEFLAYRPDDGSHRFNFPR